jgi:hypothetical protein
MMTENDVVAFVDYWSTGNRTNPLADRESRFAEYLVNTMTDGTEISFLDALSEDAAMAWYQVGGCPAAGELYVPFAGDHTFNNLEGFCLEACCGCKVCEDYYAGLDAGNQSFLLQDMEAFCKSHERSCMNGECSMCGPCFAKCSYDETELSSDAKALLTFLAAAKEPDPTLCKMCCHMDMPAVSQVWNGIAQCPEEYKAKARDSMGCDTWDFKVSCTCEKDEWLKTKDDDNMFPAVDSESRATAAFCQNAVTYWVSVYHCNDVYASLSRDQPAFWPLVDKAFGADPDGRWEDRTNEVDLEPTPDRPAPSLCDICGATCAFNFEGACQCPIPDGPPPDEKYAMFIFCGIIGGLLFIYFYDFCVPKPVA